MVAQILSHLSYPILGCSPVMIISGLKVLSSGPYAGIVASLASPSEDRQIMTGSRLPRDWAITCCLYSVATGTTVLR